jgi:hypothetical protein
MHTFIPRSIRAPAAATIVALAALAWPGLDAQQPAAVRIVAIGDVHGDYTAFSGILRTAGLIDTSGAWSGGAAVLVQTGDYLDRGPDVRRVMDFLRALEPAAAKAGGRVNVLLGNHEALNLLGDVRDVNPGSYAAFAGTDAEKRRQEAFRKYTALGDARARALGSRPQPYNQRDREAWLAAHPPGYVEYASALQPEGEYGGWLRERSTVIEIAGTVFMHAGIDPPAAPSALEEINRSVSDEIRKFDTARQYMVGHGLILPFFSLQETLAAAEAEAQGLRAGTITAPDLRHIEMINAVLGIGKSPLLTSDGPLWFRGFATWPDDEGRMLMSQLLSRYGARRFVSGHSIQRDGRIAGRFDGRAFLIDTAMSRAYKGGRASALEIAGDRITAIYEDSKIVLVEGAEPAPARR